MVTPAHLQTIRRKAHAHSRLLRSIPVGHWHTAEAAHRKSLSCVWASAKTMRRVFPLAAVAPLLQRIEVNGRTAPGTAYTAARLICGADQDVDTQALLIRRGNNHLTAEEADAVAIALGRHPVLIWPDLWASGVGHRYTETDYESEAA